MFRTKPILACLLALAGYVLTLGGVSPAEAGVVPSNSAAALKAQISQSVVGDVVKVKRGKRGMWRFRGRRGGFKRSRRAFRGRVHRRRFYRRRPRVRIYLGYPYYYGRYYRRGGRCTYWRRRCAANWGYGNSNFYGCLRYYGCY